MWNKDGKMIYIYHFQLYLCFVNSERKIIAYKKYFVDFVHFLDEREARKIFYVIYVIDMLKTQERLSTKFVKHVENSIYELRLNMNQMFIGRFSFLIPKM